MRIWWAVVGLGAGGYNPVYAAPDDARRSLDRIPVPGAAVHGYRTRIAARAGSPADAIGERDRVA